MLLDKMLPKDLNVDKNSNSISKQGKFIRIHFNNLGKLASADIETCKYWKYEAGIKNRI